MPLLICHARCSYEALAPPVALDLTSDYCASLSGASITFVALQENLMCHFCGCLNGMRLEAFFACKRRNIVQFIMLERLASEAKCEHSQSRERFKKQR